MVTSLVSLGTVLMPSTKLTLKDKKVILDTARHAIQYGLTYHQQPALELKNYSEALQENKATFVTLKETNQLRGCIGTLKAHQPLIQDVAEHAYSAAFNDNRFLPVNALEEPMIHISVSILSEPESVSFTSEDDLLGQLTPGKDGIILNYRSISATFLPGVWEELSTPEQFMAQLKQKAGLDKDFWSSHMSIKRYYSDTID